VPSLKLAVIHAQEPGTPQDREKVHRKLITNLPVQSRREGLEKLSWYTMRWQNDISHKILKPGCKAEASKPRTAEGSLTSSPSSVFSVGATSG
jgi:hypothetical protein